ncbi:MAG: hypothetical protein ACOH2H_15375 [Cypionkella sp.]
MAIIDRAYNRYALIGRLEAAYGTAEATFDEFDGLLCVDVPVITFENDNVPRNLALPWMGNSEEIAGTKRARIKCKTELVGSGTAGTEPAWGKWLRACGFSETILNTGLYPCVTYKPKSDTFEGMTSRFNRSGVRYTMTGSRGTAKFKLDAFAIPTIDLEYLGFDVQPVAAGIPGINLSKFIDPQVVNTENSGSLMIGGTLVNGRAVNSGTILPCKGLMWDMQGKLAHRKLIDGEHIAITDHPFSGKVTINLSTADEVQWWSDVRNLKVSTLGFTHGTADGRRITVWAPRVQFSNPQQVNDDGSLLLSFDLRALPGQAGQPEMQVIAW